MANTYSVVAGSTALVAATAKTLIELATGSGVANVITRVAVSFDGVDASKVPVKVDWIRYTSTGTGTAYTPNKIKAEAGPAAASTAKVNLTAEGTGSITVIDSILISPTAAYAEAYPLGRELTMTTSQFLGLRLTAPAAVNAVVTVYFEE